MVKLYTYAAVLGLGYVVLNILVFWINSRAKEAQWERMKEQKNFRGNIPKNTEEKQIINYDAIIANDNSTSELYKYAKETFNILLKEKRLTREQILYLKQIINSCIPKEHMDLYKIKYKNDCHEIYCKLKSSFIDQETYERIISYLTMIKEN